MRMTEDQARGLCRKHGALFSIRKRRERRFVYVVRWLPTGTVQALGHKPGISRGQSFDRSVWSLNQLAEIDEATLVQRIADLSVNPNKQKPSPSA